MITKRIDLYQHFGIERKPGSSGYLNGYLFQDAEEGMKLIRPAILVVAGGGYSHVSEREMKPVALKYAEDGFSCFVLEYSTAPISYPTQLLEGVMAMLYIRQNAEGLSIDENHIAALGFSAGAHLCGMLATLSDNELQETPFYKNLNKARPDAVVLGYPVVSAIHSPHKGSFANISGGDERLYALLSIEKRVAQNVSPAFIWGCLDDPVVHSDNGFLLAQAYKKAGVPFEYHLFESCNGIHGLSICEKETLYENETVKAWVRLSKKWLYNRGFLVQ